MANGLTYSPQMWQTKKILSNIADIDILVPETDRDTQQSYIEKQNLKYR